MRQAVVGCCLELLILWDVDLFSLKMQFIIICFQSLNILKLPAQFSSQKDSYVHNREWDLKNNPHIKYYDDAGSKISSSPAALDMWLFFHPEHLLEHYF